MKKKILVAIDDEFLRRIYVDFFTEEGFSVSEFFYNGKDAIAVVIEEMPDVILIDALIAEKDDFSFFKHMRENEKTKKIPVLMFSKVKEDGYREKALKFEVRDFIVGAYNSPLNVLAKVKTHLGFEKSYAVAVDTNEEKIKELADDLGYENLICEKCSAPMKLLLIRDLSKGERYFKVSFACFCPKD